jgi:PAS domain S-box-containing protein
MDDSARLQHIFAGIEGALSRQISDDSAKKACLSRFLNAVSSGLISALDDVNISECAVGIATLAPGALSVYGKTGILAALDEYELSALNLLETRRKEGSKAAIIRLSRFFCEARRLISSISPSPAAKADDKNAGDLPGSMNRRGPVNLFDEVMHQILDPLIGPEAVLKNICEGIIRLTTARAVAIYTISRTNENFLLKQFSAIPQFLEDTQQMLPEFLRQFTLIPRNREQGLFHVALTEKRPVFSNDIRNDPRIHMPEALGNLGIEAILVVPMLESGSELGFMSVVPSPGAAFAPDEIQSLSLFADTAAVAWRNAELYNDLRRSEQRFRNLIDSAIDLIFVLDKAGRFASINKRAEQVTGYKLKDWLGRHFSEIVNVEDLDAAMRAWSRGLSGGAEILTVRITTAQGEELLFEVNSSLIEENGETVGVMCIARDATAETRREAEFKRLHESVVEANRKLEESMAQLKATQAKLVQTEKLSAMGQLISGVAHELNNPLTGIMGYTQLLLEVVQNEKHRHDLEKINHAANRCKQIIQNLLRFSRSHKPHKERFDVRSVIESALDLKRYQLHLDGIKLITDSAQRGIQLVGDPYQIQQVILNILNNAHQSIKSGKRQGVIEVRTGMDTAKHRLRVSILDDGPGIPPEVLPKIFDPFFTTKEIGDGTGLGLSVAYGIMSEHGGQIIAESKPNVQTAFHLDFPLDAALDAGDNGRRDMAQRSAQKTSILLVDDEEVILDLLTDILTPMDRRVERAHNGTEALAKIDAASFDIIICDLKMPGMDGKTFYYKIRQSRPDLTKKIIFSTGDILSEDFRTFCAETRCRVVEKPFLLEDLKKAIEALEQELR